MQTIVYENSTKVVTAIANLNRLHHYDDVTVEVRPSYMSPDHALNIHITINGKIAGNVLIESGKAKFYAA